MSGSDRNSNVRRTAVTTTAAAGGAGAGYLAAKYPAESGWRRAYNKGYYRSIGDGVMKPVPGVPDTGMKEFPRHTINHSFMPEGKAAIPDAAWDAQSKNLVQGYERAHKVGTRFKNRRLATGAAIGAGVAGGLGYHFSKSDAPSKWKINNRDDRRRAAYVAGSTAGGVAGYQAAKPIANRGYLNSVKETVGASIYRNQHSARPDPELDLLRDWSQKHVPANKIKNRRLAAGAVIGSTGLGALGYNMTKSDESLAELGGIAKALKMGSLKSLDPLKIRQARRHEQMWDSAVAAREAGTMPDHAVATARNLALKSRKQAYRRTGAAAAGTGASVLAYREGQKRPRPMGGGY